MSSVHRTSQAHADLVEIALRIAGDNPTAADQWLGSIDQKCRLLASMPEMGRLRPELADELRCLPAGEYIIFYRPIVDGIVVVRVLHGARDLPPLFE